MKTSRDDHFTILDGKCHIFRREGSPFWWVGFHQKGRYVRSSTKQTDSSAAEVVGREWYFKKQSDIASGATNISGETFEKVSKSAIAHYESLVQRGIRSPKTLKEIKSVLASRVMPFFKKLDISSIDNTTWHRYKSSIVESYPRVTRGTLHQYKSAVRVVLNEAFRTGKIKAVPVFRDEYSTNKNIQSRPWFDENDYKKLHTAIRNHAKHLETRDRLQYEYALELYDYVIIATNTGMRVGELQNMKFSDVEIVKEKMTDKEVLVIRNIKGKRGSGVCQSYYGAVPAFRRRMKARGISDINGHANSVRSKRSKLNGLLDEKVFLIHHRTMFNNILEKAGLKYSDSNPPARRDFVSLRATYICFRLLNGVPVYEIANNCRTSVAIIESNYARHLGGQLMRNINRTEGWDY